MASTMYCKITFDESRHRGSAYFKCYGCELHCTQSHNISRGYPYPVAVEKCAEGKGNITDWREEIQ